MADDTWTCEELQQREVESAAGDTTVAILEIRFGKDVPEDLAPSTEPGTYQGGDPDGDQGGALLSTAILRTFTHSGYAVFSDDADPKSREGALVVDNYDEATASFIGSFEFTFENDGVSSGEFEVRTVTS